MRNGPPWADWKARSPGIPSSLASAWILGFIGVTDAQTVRAEGMNIAPIAPKAIPDGEGAIETLTISKEKYDRPHYPDREQC